MPSDMKSIRFQILPNPTANLFLTSVAVPITLFKKTYSQINKNRRVGFIKIKSSRFTVLNIWITRHCFVLLLKLKLRNGYTWLWDGKEA